ncbi:MAG: hypothetical protein JWP97_967 [Labilithrix sp.]|nr:hypothetical protein [Labilithrix sp.]
MASTPLLSICMIVKNEEAVLARALASAQGIGAELVVVDTGSTDRTVAIAEEAGATVHHFTWVDDFSAARNHALAHGHGTWLMVLDADEELTATFRENVTRVLGQAKAAAFRVPAQALDDQGGVQMTLMSTRLVRNGHGYGYEGRVHEDITSNVMRRGGVVADTQELPIVHHGYTAEESARKNRQERNIKLLEAAHAASPQEPRYWHYLGIEHRVLGNLEVAASWFDRMLTRAEGHELSAWSASALASIHEAEGDLGAAWAVAHAGLRGKVGRVHCLAQLGKLALAEGDPDTARWCADEIDRSPGDDLSDRATGVARAADLRAAALIAKGATPKVRDAVLALAKKLPRSAALGQHLVEVCERLSGRGAGSVDAMKRAGHQPTVVAAAMNAAFRAGAYQVCADLGAKAGLASELSAFALARLGRPEEGREELLRFGDGASPFAVVFGLAYDDEAAIAHGLAAASPAHARALAQVRSGGKVAPRDVWVVRSWLELAVRVGEDGAATALTASLPWKTSEREALRALYTYNAGDEAAAMTRALEHAHELAAQEVIGLVAHAHGDWSAAATMLSMRAAAGDAAVRVYVKGADALAHLGRKTEAERLLAAGREARPHARGLGAAAAVAGRSAVAARRA